MREPVTSSRVSLAGRIAHKSRLLAVAAIAGVALCVVGLLSVGFCQIYHAASSAIALGAGGGSEIHFVVGVLEIIDTFLIASVCVIVAMGAYQLLVDTTTSVPAWLTIKDFDDLKRRLAGVVVIILALRFLADFVNWDGPRQGLMREGLAAASIILSLSVFMKVITPAES